jgi:hypothetical protein
VQGFERADRQFLDASALAEIHTLTVCLSRGPDGVFLISFLGFWEKDGEQVMARVSARVSAMVTVIPFSG